MDGNLISFLAQWWCICLIAQWKMPFLLGLFELLFCKKSLVIQSFSFYSCSGAFYVDGWGLMLGFIYSLCWILFVWLFNSIAFVILGNLSVYMLVFCRTPKCYSFYFHNSVDLYHWVLFFGNLYGMMAIILFPIAVLSFLI